MRSSCILKDGVKTNLDENSLFSKKEEKIATGPKYLRFLLVSTMRSKIPIPEG